MKAKEIYDIAKKVMFEKSSSKDYDFYYLENLNILLIDNFQLNNDLRVSRNLEPLKDIPRLVKNEDDVPYENDLCINVLTRGLAANLFVDDDMSKYNKFYVDYMNAQTRIAPLISTQILDVYS